jgi:hypothetical protein
MVVVFAATRHLPKRAKRRRNVVGWVESWARRVRSIFDI